MTKVDPSSVGDRFSQMVSNSAQGLPRRESGGMVPFPSSDTALRETLPNRYQVLDRDGGRVLVCEEAPRITVTIDRDHTYSEADARRLGERVILLDGAGQFGPTVGDGEHLYNLDHHKRCLRAFTLSTCEQALILVLKGLRLDNGDWTVYANEPDLDTVFAIWVLLNYRRVQDLSPSQRDAILPLLRLEGAIDANGLEIADYCGLPQDVLKAEKARLDELHADEVRIKRAGNWSQIDFVDYTSEMMFKIDHVVYKSDDFLDYTRVDEVHGHVDIGNDHVAVVCRDSAGIYEVEKRLKKVWHDRLGIVALEKEEGHYTLRRAASLAGIDLQHAYAKLNLLDPAVNGRPPEKRWGGSDEIGGSPRPTGTGLAPHEIAKILKLTYKEITRLQVFRRLVAAVLWTVGLALGAGVAVVSWRLFGPDQPATIGAATELALASAVLGIGASVLTPKLSGGWTWLFGWRIPAGKDWLALVPVVLLGGVAGGAWIPRLEVPVTEALTAAVSAMVLAAVGLELCLRGLMHGLLILDHKVQRVRGRWFVSQPALASALLYTLISLGASAFIVPLPRLWSGAGFAVPAQWGLMAAAALVTGLTLAMIRERSLSVWPAVGTLAAGSALRLAFEIWQGG